VPENISKQGVMKKGTRTSMICIVKAGKVKNERKLKITENSFFNPRNPKYISNFHSTARRAKNQPPGKGGENPMPLKAPKGLTQSQKYDLCVLRSQYPEMTLGKFAELPECSPREDGRPLPLSSLSEHLKGWKDKLQKRKPSGMYSFSV